jgi:hypothetical protein
VKGALERDQLVPAGGAARQLDGGLDHLRPAAVEEEHVQAGGGQPRQPLGQLEQDAVDHRS